MEILISCVGDTDPIRNFHDGAILHIARVMKPQEIYLIHSERTIKKNKDLEKALASIEGYEPRVIAHKHLLTEVYRFDEVYEQLLEVVRDITSTKTETDSIILNLSSGTPQMKSAFFSINRLEDYNFKAVQVASPVRDSNANIRHDLGESIEVLIETNEDNLSNFVNRCIDDKATKFSQTIVKRHFRQMIDQYDYYSAYQLLKEEKNYPNRDKLLARLGNIVSVIQHHDLPDKFISLQYKNELKKALHFYLLMEMKLEVGDMSEVLFRLKLLIEYLCEFYLNEKYAKIFLYGPNSTVSINKKIYPELYRKIEGFKVDHLNLPILIEISSFLEPDGLIGTSMELWRKINKMRNDVAHSLDSIREWDDKEIKRACGIARKMLLKTFKFDNVYLEYYRDLNSELKEML